MRDISPLATTSLMLHKDLNLVTSPALHNLYFGKLVADHKFSAEVPVPRSLGKPQKKSSFFSGHVY